MIIRFSLLFSTLLLMSSCGFYNDADFSQPGPLERSRAGSGLSAGMPSEPGKCYAKCKISASVEVRKEVVEYFGIEEEVPEQILESVEVMPAGKKWVKKKADKNCLSANPDDCVVWCLQETEPVFDVRWVEIDSSSQELLQVVYSEYEHSSPEGFTEWREIVCEKDLTPALIGKTKRALIEKGYDAGNSNKIDRKLKAALLKFQTDYDYPQGQFSVESLEALGISF